MRVAGLTLIAAFLRCLRVEMMAAQIQRLSTRCAVPVGLERAGGEIGVESAFFDQELKQGLGEHMEGDLMRASEFGVQPVAEV